MKKIFRKIKESRFLELIKRHKIKSIIIGLIFLIIIFVILKPKPEPKRDVVTIEPTSVTQEVSVTGRVEATEALDLALQSGGKVSIVRVSTGDHVNAGQLLMQVNTSDLQVRLARAQASLERARLEQLKNEPKTTAEDTFAQLKEDAFTTVSDTFLDLPSIILDVDKIFSNDYISINNITSRYGSTARGLLVDARDDFKDAENAYKKVLVSYRSISRSDSLEKINPVMDETIEVAKKVSDSLKRLKSVIDFIESKDADRSDISDDKAYIDVMTNKINSHLSSMLRSKNNAKNAELGINDAGYDRTAINLSIRQAELDVRDIMVQINERTIVAPISGIITDVQAKVGETVSAGMPLISIISDSAFQITANIPESDMAKISNGSDALVTLDAYSDDIIFNAKVVSISPAGRLVDGVATYKTTFQFIESDERIKSGMTADIVIKGERRDGVFAVPQRSVVTKDGIRTVQVLVNGEIVDREVELGFRGTDGLVEITKGVSEGDVVVVFINK